MVGRSLLEYDFQDSVGYWICESAHRMQLAMNVELAPQGITWRQAQLLASLAIEGPLSQTALSQRMQIEASSLVPVLDRMEREGLVERKTSTTDRRVRNVHVLPKAEKLWRKIVASANKVRARATRGLSREQVAQLRELLEAVRQNLADGEEPGSSKESHRGKTS
ncbi:MarR family winged helix-turn-helix transcriptional regulator [Lignipirellula cremea]|uniref:Putative HTH-type transcriptional regulator YusO n=1 Tax=Lignipirellula cremea TaxID=2528010 RepID=A0A518DXW0_9BACT|nr:MarR family transcriptional regulator [Lignipirellula cremea]QDU96683.1 putative HTH-type transcriptional regulator YusO [Lignipirellula cremea]